ncbi:ATP-dependent DNA helicase [Compostimonas suwonensis]|uniref:DNA 3'-5' helicase n=1 Tax=Compostimonas suwonensis TaxID=1048394 RepID=A0A2M9BWF4_9MICO|nr:ATP-dependent DNA helicase [Compostimonas suwonensis]PJJ62282.1 DNA helicase-2/ATP-dependent DNA helicase PcrA [Compostimonas suwonensis]
MSALLPDAELTGASQNVAGSAAPASPAISALEIAHALHLPPPTPQQQAVIEAPLSPSIVVAGAGSGKTETMANRVVWLLANGHVRVPQILGLTFTRKAAGELAERIRKRITELVDTQLVSLEFDPFDAPTVATYNSFANSIFREHALRLGREPDSAILSEASAWQLARSLVVASTDERLVDLDKSVDAVTAAVLELSRALGENVAEASAVDAMAREFLTLRELPTGSARVKEMYRYVRSSTEVVAAIPPLLELATRFAEEKKRRGYVEYSDQVALALAVCERVPEVVDDYRERFRVVLLDEYQDTSVVQTRLLKTLFAGGAVMAVGDPHQSIYGWRGASSANLDEFSRDFTGRDTGAIEYALSTSWRNPRTVLQAANTLVAPLTAASAVHVEQLGARPGASDGVLDTVFPETVDDEARAIARWLHSELRRPNAKDEARSAAILCRSIKRIDAFTAALDEQGVPYHVLGLGGLLEQPVIADLVSALRVIHYPTAGSELIRLLAGARWRIGARDIRSLNGLASWLAARDHRYRPLETEVRDGLRRSVVDDEGKSLIDALDFLVEAPAGHTALSDFSADGLDRMRQAGRQLAWLRSRVGLDLLDLVTLVQQELLLDVEVAANESSPLGQPSLVAFGEQVAAFVASSESSTLGAFLGWLTEAEQRDNLAPRQEEPEPGTVQILTIHGAKGLEWDTVVVPRMVEGELPGAPRSKRGWLSLGALPYEFRGDASELPKLDWRGLDTQKEFDEAFELFMTEVEARHAEEQRRLAYVAITRARESVLLSGSFWSTQTKPRPPGAFLHELARAGVIDPAALPEASEFEQNPLESATATRLWPLDPFGTRRGRVESAAALVRSADPLAHTPWSHDIELLLAERHQRQRANETVVAPARIPASRFKDYVSAPQTVAASLRRPMPERPFRQTRTGTRFHSWVEQRFGHGAVPDTIDADASELDFDLDLGPGPSPDPDLGEPSAEAQELERLQANFERSEWAGRRPEFVEVEIHLRLGGHIVICKLDAVYVQGGGADGGGADGGGGGIRYQIVDWKTGKAPKDADDLELKQLQLALYRLAFARWKGVDPTLVDAVFYFVGDDLVVRPERLYSEDDLLSAWGSVFVDEEPSDAASSGRSESNSLSKAARPFSNSDLS